MGGGYSQVYSVQNYDYLRHACVPGHLICLRKKEDINNASQSPIGIIPKSTRLIQQSILFFSMPTSDENLQSVNFFAVQI